MNLYMINLSIRLKTIYDMVEPNLNVCDLCSDHGLIPISLIKNNISNKVIATDITESSIDKIKYNSNLYLNHVQSKKLDIRKGDGLSIIDYHEFDILIISGIGTDLMIDILSNIQKYEFKYLILSPQTKIETFRQYLIDNNFFIQNEKIVFDDEQYYFILKVTKNNNNIKQEYKDYELMYSKYLIQDKDPILYKYLNKQLNQYADLITKIKNSNTNNNTAIKNYEYLYDITKNIIDKW